MNQGTHTLATLDRDAARGDVVTAVVEDISPDGIALVVLAGETHRREAASLLHFPSAAAASEALLGRTVLVLTRGAQPVILGTVTERLWETREPTDDAETEVRLPADAAPTVQVDKRQVDLVASDEIRLTCGKSSLVLRRDGTVVLRGVTIVTRASRANKIRGATVNIN